MAASQPLNPLRSAAHAQQADAIARETQTPVEVVRVIYEEEVASLSHDAKITQFVGVIASRRVKMRLRH